MGYAGVVQRMNDGLRSHAHASSSLAIRAIGGYMTALSAFLMTSSIGWILAVVSLGIFGLKTRTDKYLMLPFAFIWPLLAILNIYLMTW